MFRTLRNMGRLWSMGRTLARHDALFPLEIAGFSPFLIGVARWILALGAKRPLDLNALRPGQRLAAALQAMGPSFIKLGQGLSVRSDLIGEELADDLSALQDRLPSFPGAEAVTAIEQYFESGPQAIWDRVRELTVLGERRFEQIDGVTIRSPQTDGSRTGLFCFRVEGIPSQDLPPYLESEHGVVCRAVRQEDVVRLSLHAFNNQDDIERVARGVEQALRDGVPSVDH